MNNQVSDLKSKPRVLLVEDELLVRMFAVDVLEDAGFAVDEAGSADEAMARLNQTPHNLSAAVVDLGLPDRPGDELAADLLHSHPSLPILIASGRSEQELRERFGTEQRIGVLVKPYTSTLLLDALASLGVNAGAGD